MEPGSPQQRRLRGHGPRDAGEKGRVGEGWADLGEGKAWLKLYAAWRLNAWPECWGGAWSILYLL